MRLKLFLLLLVLLTSFLSVYTQEYDLIVRNNGDSIVCNIDSISDSKIYFESKYNSAWVHSNLKRSDVSDFKEEVIDLKSVKLIPGTSQIRPFRAGIESIWEIQKNSVYIDLHTLLINAFYERIIPMNDKLAITAGGGIIQTWGFASETFFAPKLSLLMGGVKHFFEPGIAVPITLGGEQDEWHMGILGYRYLGPQGFVFRASVYAQWESGGELLILPGISLGLTF
jgi:hypothetical protein